MARHSNAAAAEHDAPANEASDASATTGPEVDPTSREDQGGDAPQSDARARPDPQAPDKGESPRDGQDGPATPSGRQPRQGRGGGGQGPKARKIKGGGGKRPNQGDTDADSDAGDAQSKDAKAPPETPQKKKKPDPKPVSFKPIAEPARMHRRHYGLILAMLLLVAMPVFVVSFYLYTYAHDQYASSTGFTVRSDEGGAATDFIGGLAQLAGGGSTGDADILFEFIESQEIVQRINEDLDLVAHYSAPHDEDPFFALEPDARIEDLVSHWRNIVRVSFDSGSGLIDLRVLAFDPEMAHAVATAILSESQILVNELNEQARLDAMRFAEADLAAAIERLRSAREALTEFRTRTQIVDPTSDLQGRMGVLNNLQQQLAEALIELDLLAENSANSTDPRVIQAERRIDVIRNRIAQERQNFTLDDVGTNGEDYPTLMAEFEGIVVDREFAEESYRAALAAVDVARTNAARQGRYLAVFIRPTMPESAEFPRRDLIVALTALFAFLTWGILALVYYSIRDRQ